MDLQSAVLPPPAVGGPFGDPAPPRDLRHAVPLGEANLRLPQNEPSEGDLDDLETDLREARARRDTATGELGEFESGLPDIAAAEERVERAAAELARVQGLDQTLGNETWKDGSSAFRPLALSRTGRAPPTTLG